MGLGASAARDAKDIEAYFEGKVVWVTGASGGLGEALCLALAKGARPLGLVLSARRSDELERVKKACLEANPQMKAAVLPLDLADVGSLAAVAEKASALYGRVDVLVNNGGVGFRGLACETGVDLDKRVMDIDYFSGVALVKALLPKWLEDGQGHVVQISSVQGFFGLPGRTAYAAAKHAAVGFYDSLRAEVEDAGVTVTLVGPGYIKTNHSTNAAHDANVKYPEGHTSKGVEPEVLALQILGAAGRKVPEMLPAAIDAKVATVLRCIAPRLLFWIMNRRAKKERVERQEYQRLLQDEAPSQTKKAA